MSLSGGERTHTQNILDAMAYNLKRYTKSLCFKTSNERKTPDFGSLTLPKSGKEEVCQQLHLP